MPENTGDGAAGTGVRLRDERIRQDLSIEDISERTKIPERHLASIESGDFASLPGRTYAIGFARNYARALGLDQEEIANGVRGEMNTMEPQHARREMSRIEPGDPARIPSAKLAWGVAALLVGLIVVGIIFWRGFFMPAAELPPLAQASEEADSAAEPASASTADAEAPAPTGTVSLTATAERVWVKIYDRNGRQLFQKEMAEGETFSVPADADGPQIWTGRPDALSLTIGGRKVAPLAQDERVIRDVPIDAASLTARPPGPGIPTRSP